MWTLYTAGRVLAHEGGKRIKLTVNEVSVVQAIVETGKLPEPAAASSKGRVTISRLRAKFILRGMTLPFQSVYGTQGYRMLEPIKLG